MAKLIKVITGYKKDGTQNVGGYRITLQKTEIENTCKLTTEDELQIEYYPKKIVISKKEVEE